MSDDVDVPSFRLSRANQNPLNGLYIPRICRDCPADITHLHGNKIRCVACTAEHKQKWTETYTANRYPITASAVMRYMELYTPKALKDIKDRIHAMRRAGTAHLLKKDKK